MIIENIADPKVNYQLFDEKLRTEGLSGFMRLRNEAEFLSLSIESWLPLLDELIIVYNNCQDNTEEIVEKYAEFYPNKVKAYHYLPIVYPQGSDNYKKLDPNNKHSLVNYYNFALSKTTKKWAIKLDGDLILDQSKVSHLRNLYNELRVNKPDSFLPVSGVNLVDNRGLLFVPSSSKYCGVHGDLCIFKVDSNTVFKKGETVEYLDLPHRKKLNNIFAYYHMKFIKSDFGIGNYDFENNPDSSYYAKTFVAILMMRFIPVNTILDIHNLSRVTLREFQVNYNRDYKKMARQYLSSTGGVLSLNKLLIELYSYFVMNIKGKVKNILLKYNVI